MARRKEMLSELGFKQSDKAPAKLVADRRITGIDRLVEEKGLKCAQYRLAHAPPLPLTVLCTSRCLICHEGTTLRPRETLGIYVFCKDVPMGGMHDAGLSLTTVTHFNIIHYSCHRCVAACMSCALLGANACVCLRAGRRRRPTSGSSRQSPSGRALPSATLTRCATTCCPCLRRPSRRRSTPRGSAAAVRPSVRSGAHARLHVQGRDVLEQHQLPLQAGGAAAGDHRGRPAHADCALRLRGELLGVQPRRRAREQHPVGALPHADGLLLPPQQLGGRANAKGAGPRTAARPAGCQVECSPGEWSA
jgi:hypothetical protein